MTEEQTQNQPTNPGTSDQPQYVTPDQLTAVVSYMSSLIQESLGQARQTQTPSQPTQSPGEKEPDVVVALQNRVQQLEQTNMAYVRETTLRSALDKAGYQPKALKFFQATLPELRVQEGVAFLSGGKLLSEYLEEFKTDELGKELLKVPTLDVPTKQNNARTQKTEGEKPKATELLTQAFGKG